MNPEQVAAETERRTALALGKAIMDAIQAGTLSEAYRAQLEALRKDIDRLQETVEALRAGQAGDAAP